MISLLKRIYFFAFFASHDKEKLKCPCEIYLSWKGKDNKNKIVNQVSFNLHKGNFYYKPRLVAIFEDVRNEVVTTHGQPRSWEHPVYGNPGRGESESRGNFFPRNGIIVVQTVSAIYMRLLHQWNSKSSPTYLILPLFLSVSSSIWQRHHKNANTSWPRTPISQPLRNPRSYRWDASRASRCFPR